MVASGFVVVLWRCGGSSFGFEYVMGISKIDRTIVCHWVHWVQQMYWAKSREYRMCAQSPRIREASELYRWLPVIPEWCGVIRPPAHTPRLHSGHRVHLPIPLVYTQVILYTCPYPLFLRRSYCTPAHTHAYCTPAHTPRLYAGHTVHLPIPLVFTQVIQYTFCPSSDRTKISWPLLVTIFVLEPDPTFKISGPGLENDLIKTADPDECNILYSTVLLPVKRSIKYIHFCWEIYRHCPLYSKVEWLVNF